MRRIKNRGITLIALIITIIVMLILVTVSIQIALNTGLFDSAGKATQDYKTAHEEEQQLGAGQVTIGGTTYNSIEEYIEKCDHKWGEWEVDTEEGKQERNCENCEKVETKIIIGATIVGYNPSIAEDGSTINTKYQSLGAQGDKTIAGGSSGNGYANQEFTVTSITEWQILGEENGQIIITTKNPIKTDVRKCVPIVWTSRIYKYDR